jgi:hypothetical protein
MQGVSTELAVGVKLPYFKLQTDEGRQLTSTDMVTPKLGHPFSNCVTTPTQPAGPMNAAALEGPSPACIGCAAQTGSSPASSHVLY